MKISRYLAVGISCYLIFLIVVAPASLLHHLVPESSTPKIRLGHLDGTLWNGQASNVSIDHHTFTDLRWHFNFWKIALGQISVDTDGKFQQRPFETRLGVTALGTVHISDTRAEIDGATMGDLIQLPLGQLAGIFKITLENASISRNTIPVASGNIFWDDAAVIVAETARLGDVTIELSESDSDPLVAVIRNTNDADIRLSGKANVADNGDYVADIQMTLSAGASRNIQSSLGMFARKQPDGSYRINNKGNLKQYGLLQ